MRNLETFCQWIVHRFSKESGKKCYVTFSKRMSRCLGKCIRYRSGNIFTKGTIYEIRLNLDRIRQLKPDLVEDLILHECAHTFAHGHGHRFQNICIRMEIDSRVRGVRASKEDFINEGEVR